MRMRTLGLTLALATLFAFNTAHATPSEVDQVSAQVLKLVGNKATPYAKILEALFSVQMGMAFAGGDEAQLLARTMTRKLRKAREAGDGGSNAQVAEAVWGVMAKSLSTPDVSAALGSAPHRRFKRLLKTLNAPGLHVQNAMFNAMVADEMRQDPRYPELLAEAQKSLLTAGRKLLMAGTIRGTRASRIEQAFFAKAVSGHASEDGRDLQFFDTLRKLDKIRTSGKLNKKRVKDVDALAKSVGLKWSRRTGRYYTPRTRPAPARQASASR